MGNIFQNLGSWFTSGTEDFFTASLALFLERNEVFREAFLDWLSMRVQDDLHRRRWIIKAQVQTPSSKGTAVIDMELRNPDLLLWFEHKIAAGAGKYGDIDQIEKYLDAANRVMLGIEDSNAPVEWPATGPEKGLPRVVLFYVTKDPKTLNRNRYEGRIYSPAKRFGLVWVPPDGHLRWRDFWYPAQRALDGALSGELGEFERTLSRQFLRYWKSLPGMWTHALAGSDWSELLPDQKELPEGQSCPFDALWEEVRRLAREQLRCQNIYPYLGYELRLEFRSEDCQQVDQIYVRPIPDIAKERNWTDRLGPQALRLLLRRRDSQDWPDFRSEVTFDDRWPARLRLHRVGSAQQLEILVGIYNWSKCHDTMERCAAIADAFLAGIKLARDEAGVEFPGLVKDSSQ